MLKSVSLFLSLCSLGVGGDNSTVLTERRKYHQLRSYQTMHGDQPYNLKCHKRYCAELSDIIFSFVPILELQECISQALESDDACVYFLSYMSERLSGFYKSEYSKAQDNQIEFMLSFVKEKYEKKHMPSQAVDSSHMNRFPVHDLLGMLPNSITLSEFLRNHDKVSVGVYSCGIYKRLVAYVRTGKQEYFNDASTLLQAARDYKVRLFNEIIDKFNHVAYPLILDEKTIMDLCHISSILLEADCERNYYFGSSKKRFNTSTVLYAILPHNLMGISLCYYKELLKSWD